MRASLFFVAALCAAPPVFFAALCAAPGIAVAADGAVIVLQLEAPRLPAATVTALEEALRTEVALVLPARAKMLPRPALDYSGLREAAGCVDDGAKCMQSIGKLISATQVFRAVISGTAAQATATFDVVDVSSGKAKTSSGELGDVAPESAAELRVMVALAFGVKRDVPPGTISLYVSSSVGKLEGAEVFVDGVATKPADLGKLVPGKHSVEVRQTGFEPFSWTGLIRAGRDTRVGVTFTPTRVSTPVASTKPAPATPLAKPAPSAQSNPALVASAPLSRGPGYLLPGLLGAASLVTGVVAAIHAFRVLGLQDEHNATCAPTMNRPEGCGRIDAPGDDCTLGVCEDGRTASTLANVFWIASGTLATGAVTLFIIESSQSDGAVSVAPAPGGATLTFTY